MRPVTLLNIAATFVIWLAACSKTDAPAVSYGNSFTKIGSAPSGIYMLFSKSGEVTNNRASHFMAIDSAFISGSARQLGENPSYDVDSIRFIDQQHALVDLNGAHLPYTVTSGGSSFILTSINTLTGYYYADPISQSMNYHILKDKFSIFNEDVYTVTQGNYTFYYKHADKMLVTSGQGDADISVPIIFFVIHKANGSVLAS